MRVLVIPDLHLPVAHERALDFVVDIYNKHDCDTVVFIGDIVDHHAISKHDVNPNCPSAKAEYEMVSESLKQWLDTFPRAKVCIGNHDERPELAAEREGIPACYLKTYKEVWKTPKWDWDFSFEIDGVYYFHGVGSTGKTPALNKADTIHMPVVMGHVHSRAGIHYGAGPKALWFGMDTGCLVDNDAWQFAYGKHCNRKPLLGCGVVLDGTPYYEPMDLEVYK
jgi:predicted phosphodiesterase